MTSLKNNQSTLNLPEEEEEEKSITHIRQEVHTSYTYTYTFTTPMVAKAKRIYRWYIFHVLTWDNERGKHYVRSFSWEIQNGTLSEIGATKNIRADRRN